MKQCESASLFSAVPLLITALLSGQAGSQCGVSKELRSTVIGRKLSLSVSMYRMCMFRFLVHHRLQQAQSTEKEAYARLKEHQPM